MRRYFTDVSFEQNQLIEARFENLPTPPTSPQPGYVYFDTTLLTYRGWDGFIWIEFNTTIPQNLLDLDTLLSGMNGYPDYFLKVNNTGTAVEYVDLAAYLESILPDINDFKVFSYAYPSVAVVNVQHNLDSENIIYKTYNSFGVEYIPGQFEIIDSMNVRITNDPPTAGTISMLAIV